MFSLLSTIVLSDFIRIYFDKGRSASCAQGVTGVAAVAAFKAVALHALIDGRQVGASARSPILEITRFSSDAAIDFAADSPHADDAVLGVSPDEGCLAIQASDNPLRWLEDALCEVPTLPLALE